MTQRAASALIVVALTTSAPTSTARCGHKLVKTVLSNKPTNYATTLTNVSSTFSCLSLLRKA